MSRLLIQRIAMGCAAAVWLIVVSAGFVSLANYDRRPGAASSAPPQINALPPDAPQKHRLLMFVHPRCPCSTASLRELERLMARCVDELDATIYFMRPADAPDAWAQGSLWNHAAQIPGVQTVIDAAGKQAERFAAKTSGSVVLYDATGRLLYEGGITAGRGHEGDNRGKDALISLARGEAAANKTCPVYGCSLSSNSLPGN